jgi:CheY-specific phosphatase CheX
MELKEALYRSVQEIFKMINLKTELIQEIKEPSLTSVSDINAVIGFNYSIKGNIVFALDKNSALTITAAMIGDSSGGTDSKIKNAVGDMAKLIADLALGKLNINSSIYFTPPPTLVTGENVFLLISRTKTERLLFRINDAQFSIAYSLE